MHSKIQTWYSFGRASAFLSFVLRRFFLCGFGFSSVSVIVDFLTLTSQWLLRLSTVVLRAMQLHCHGAFPALEN